MKQTKTWLIIAAVLIWIGISGFCWVMAVHHWDFSLLGRKNTDAKAETSVFDIAEDFRNISIRSGTEDIVLILSENGTCRVEFCEPENRKPSASVRNGTLQIEVQETGDWFSQASLFSLEPTKITIWLPKNEYAQLSLDESTGDVTIPNDFRFENIDISASTGDIRCSASASGAVRVTTSTGDIHIDGISAEELSLTVSTGKAEVRSAACRGNMDVTVTTGKAELTDVTCGSFSSKGSTGDIILENVIASGMISIERSTGGVKLERCDGAELYIKTDTGNISGSLLSEKVFIAHSDTGRVKVPETITGGKCKITSDTGNIEITVG